MALFGRSRMRIPAFAIFLVFLFAANGSATTYDLASAPTWDLNIIGGSAGNALGNGGLELADIDDDGTMDLLISGYYVDFNSNTDVGALYIINNIGSRTGTIDLNASKVPTDFNLAIFGSAGSDYFGFYGAGIGDVDRDGKQNDIAVGAPFYDHTSRADAGIIYVFKDINSESGIINLAIPSGRAKVDLNIIGANASAYLGWAMNAFGDANSDGYSDDLVIGGQGATYNANTGAGCVYLINGVGSKLGSIDIASTSAVNFKICGSQTNYAVGYGDNFLIDFDLDGYADDWVTEGWQDTSTGDGVHVIKSAGLETGTITEASTVIDLNILGPNTRSSMCERYCLFGDADNDGNADDFFVPTRNGDPSSRTDAGQVFLFEDIRNDPGVINLSAVSGKARVDLNIFGSVGSDFLGYSGVSLGDLDADGYKETLAVGAYGHDPLGRSAAGMIYLIGDIHTKSGIIDLNSPGTNVDHNFIGALASDNLGQGHVLFGDADNGGYANDLFITAPGSDPAGRSGAGTIWLYSDLGTGNTTPDVNVWKIDSYPDAQPLPTFSSYRDGNLTIDFNVTDDRNYAVLDVNYSSTATQGSGTAVVNDLNLSTLSTSGPRNCDDNMFTDVTRCAVDVNIAGMSDGNYYILAALTDGTNTSFEASDASFMVDNTAPALTISSPATGTSTTSTSVTVTYSATDAGSGVVLYEVSTDGSTYTSNTTALTYAFSLSAGSHTLYVRATDGAGNGDVESISVTVTEEESTNSTAATGSLITQQNQLAIPIPTPTFERTATFGITPAGEPLTLRFTKNYIHPVVSVTFFANELPSSVAMIVSTEKKFEPLDDAHACEYFDLGSPKKLSFSFDAEIRFHVEKECVERAGGNEKDVRLYHFEKEWSALETTLELETEEEYYFSARTNTFSPFAIGVDVPAKQTMVETPVVNEIIPEKPAAAEEIVAPITVPREKTFPLDGVGLAVFLVLLFFIFRNYTEKKHRHHSK